MKKNLFAMIVVIMSGAAAHAFCYPTRAKDICAPDVSYNYNVPEQHIHCAGKNSTLDINFARVAGVADYANFSYAVTTYGKCPSRNCGSVDVHEMNGSSDQGGADTKIWISSVGNVEYKNLVLTNSLDASKSISVTYSTENNQVNLQSLTIGGQAFDQIAKNQFSCTIK